MKDELYSTSIKVYKIQHKDSFLFSSGGCYPTFNKDGKTWNKLGHVKSHLKQFKDTDRLDIYRNCKIVTYELNELVGEDICVTKKE